MTRAFAHARRVRAADFAREALADIDGRRDAVYQEHGAVADDDPALPPFQYDAVVSGLGFDPSCVHGADRCAGDECCCVETHGSALGALLRPTRSA